MQVAGTIVKQLISEFYCVGCTVLYSQAADLSLLRTIRKGRDLTTYVGQLSELEAHLLAPKKTFDSQPLLLQPLRLFFYVRIRITNEISQLQTGKRCLLFITCMYGE